MRTLNNDFKCCELLNLRYNPNGRGPYVVQQTGIAPDATTLREDPFLLRKDGTWVLNFAVFVLPAEEQESNFLYRDIAEAMDMLQNLRGKLRVEEKWPKGKSEAEILADMQSTSSRIFSRIRDSKGGPGASTTEPQDSGPSEERSSFDFAAVMQERRDAVEKSIRVISNSELKTLGDEIFPDIEDSWRRIFFDFLEENAGSTFYHAATNDRIHIIYCRDREKGIWFMPGQGKGPMQKRTLAIMKEIVDSQ